MGCVRQKAVEEAKDRFWRIVLFWYKFLRKPVDKCHKGFYWDSVGRGAFALVIFTLLT